MIAIVITACLVQDPNVCRDFQIPINAGFDERSCALHAPPHFGKWAKEHPGWTIKRWKCRPASVNDI